jgi:formylglycine-generating enzyme required for sulfatase activity
MNSWPLRRCNHCSSEVYSSWDDASEYVTWLSKWTGKDYRLLSEAEWEYAARADSTTNYPWGDDIKKDGKPMANCKGCGSEWEGKQTAPVGSFPHAANAFGLHDMHGNVTEWVEDCWNNDFNGAPTNGSAWADGDCNRRVARGGSWGSGPEDRRSTILVWDITVGRFLDLGFRVGRTVTP